MKAKQSKSICVYCGNMNGATRDHIPPRCLFPKPKPTNLVTVPCCETCRASQSADDEYFKNMIAIRHGAAVEPQIMGSVHRSFVKPQKKGFTQALLDSMLKIDTYTRAGIYLGKASGYQVDLERLCRVIRRTALGLFFHKYGLRLPGDHTCAVYALDGFQNLDSSAKKTLETLINEATRPTPTTFGKKVFTYWFQAIEGRQFTTLWAFLVYSRVGFLALTGPSEDLERFFDSPRILHG